MNKTTLLFLSVALVGCGLVEEIRQGSASRQTPPEHHLVEQAIATRPATPLRTTLGLHSYEVLYLGARGGCDYVSVTNLEFNLHSNYRKCGPTITEAGQPAPLLPEHHPQARFAIEQNIQHAYLNRTARQMWEGYQIDSVQVGPPRADGCAQIFTKITHNQMLVKTSLNTVCQEGIQK